MPTLIDFFHDQFLEVQDLSSVDEKQYRNSIARASQMLEKPVEYIDVIEPGFREWYVESLLRLGFSPRRAEDFAWCLTKLKKAFRESNRATPQPPNYVEQAFDWITDHRLTIKGMFTDNVLGDDAICLGSYQEILAMDEQKQPTDVVE